MSELEEILGCIVVVLAITFLTISYLFDYQEKFYVCSGETNISFHNDTIINRSTNGIMFRTEGGGVSWKIHNLFKGNIWARNFFDSDILLFGESSISDWNGGPIQMSDSAKPFVMKKPSKWPIYYFFEKKEGETHNISFNLLNGILENEANYDDKKHQ